MVHEMPASWIGNETVVMLAYPGMTALDMVGPQYMFAALMGAKVLTVARTREPVLCDSGLVIAPDTTFDECPAKVDVLCVPGGAVGTLAALKDDTVVGFRAKLPRQLLPRCLVQTRKSALAHHVHRPLKMDEWVPS